MFENNDKLLDAMVLLEIARKMYPESDHIFSKYSTSDLMKSAHDLIQAVHSNGESDLKECTREVLASLEAARRYVDCGGPLINNSTIPNNNAETGAPSMFRRLLSRIGEKV